LLRNFCENTNIFSKLFAEIRNNYFCFNLFGKLNSNIVTHMFLLSSQNVVTKKITWRITFKVHEIFVLGKMFSKLLFLVNILRKFRAISQKLAYSNMIFPFSHKLKSPFSFQPLVVCMFPIPVMTLQIASFFLKGFVNCSDCLNQPTVFPITRLQKLAHH
jgi:hypothetical protein